MCLKITRQMQDSIYAVCFSAVCGLLLCMFCNLGLRAHVNNGFICEYPTWPLLWERPSREGHALWV